MYLPTWSFLLPQSGAITADSSMLQRPLCALLALVEKGSFYLVLYQQSLKQTQNHFWDKTHHPPLSASSTTTSHSCFPLGFHWAPEQTKHTNRICSMRNTRGPAVFPLKKQINQIHCQSQNCCRPTHINDKLAQAQRSSHPRLMTQSLHSGCDRS